MRTEEPVMIVPTPPTKRERLRKQDEWELAMFDSAVLFTAIEVHGRAGRTRDEFTTLPEALVSAADRPACVYAVAPSGRTIVLDRADWPRWRARWDHTHSEQENQAVTTTQTTDQSSVFLLTWGDDRGPSDSRVMRFPSRAAAEAYYYEELPAKMTAHVIETALDLSDRVIFSNSVLVTIYNKIAAGAGSVRRFESLSYARERVFGEIVRRFGSDAYTTPTPAPEPATGPVATTKEKPTMAKAKTTAATRGRKPNISDGAKIVVLAGENPKREGSEAHGRFALYRSGMKVSTFIEKGGRRIDLAYDAAKEYIRIDDPETVAA